MSYTTRAPVSIGEVLSGLEIVKRAPRDLKVYDLRAREEAEEAYCRKCYSLEKCQYSGARGYHRDWGGDPNTYIECQLHKCWAAKVKLERGLKESGIPRWYWEEDMREWLYSHHEARYDEALRGLNAIYQGELRGLVIEGPARSGKSKLVSSLVVSLVKRGEEVRYWNAGELANELRYSNERYAEVLEGAKSVPYLILEDVGAERLSEYSEGQLKLVLSVRRRAGERTVVSIRGGVQGALREEIEALERVRLP